MKAKRSIYFLFSVLFMLFILNSNQLTAQSSECVDCNNNNVKIGYNNSTSNSYQYQSILGYNNITSRNNAIAIGSDSKASFSHSYVIGSSSESNGIKSVVLGSNSIAQSTYSFAIGYNAKSMFGNAFSVGNFVSSGATGGFVFGLGISSAEPLTNPVENSLAIGMKSTKPTLFISMSPESKTNDRSGRIGIGNITAPQAKLHIRADDNEDASLLLEPSNPKRYMAKLQLLDANSGLTVGAESGLELFTNLKSMQFTAPVFNFAGNQVNMPALRINNAYSLPVTVGKPGEFLSADGTWAYLMVLPTNESNNICGTRAALIQISYI